MTDQIKIGPITYQVKEVKNLENGDGHALWGQAYHQAFEIRIAKDRHTRESRFVTTWHEVLHCLEPIYGVELLEQDIIVIASVISQVLQDNPGMNWTEYLKESEHSQ